MEKIIVALLVMFVFIFIATFVAIRYEVKNWCAAQGLDFKRYWKDFLCRKVRAGENNEYFLEKYKIKKEDKYDTKR